MTFFLVDYMHEDGPWICETPEGVLRCIEQFQVTELPHANLDYVIGASNVTIMHYIGYVAPQDKRTITADKFLDEYEVEYKC